MNACRLVRPTLYGLKFRLIAQCDQLADGVRSALDLDALYAAMGLNGRSRT